MTTIGITWAAV